MNISLMLKKLIRWGNFIMTKQELNTLSDLLLKLQEERLQEYRDEGQDIDSMDDEEIMELDDSDNLLQGIDTVFCVVQRIRGE